MGRKKKEFKDEFGYDLIPTIIKEYESGMTLMELASKYNTTDMTIRKKLIENNITLRPPQRRTGTLYNKVIVDPDFDEQVNKRRSWGLNDYEIARILDVSVLRVKDVKPKR